MAQSDLQNKIQSPSVEAERQWFVMRDFKKYNAKNPAYKLLPSLGVECFTPMHWIMITRGGKKVREYVPVVQNLLFVHDSRIHLDPIVERTEKLQYIFVRGAAQGTPMVVPESDMNRFIKAVSTDSETIYFTPEELRPDMIGKNVEISGGPLDGYTGTLLKVQGSKKRRLIVRLEGFFAAAVEVNPDYVRFI